VRIVEELQDPFRQLRPLIAAHKPVVGKDHQSVVRFAAYNAPNALRDLTDCIEGQVL
jgi:hypothetical protein